MKIIEEIIGELTNKDIHLTDVLIRTKVLAFKLKNNELKEWIDAELEGYTKNNIPEYRVLPCQITCTISNGFQRMQNYPIPLLGLDGKLKDLMTKMRLYQSISTLDDFVLDDSTNNTLSHYIPAEYYALLSRGFAHGVIVEFAQRFIDRVQVIQVLTSVKSKLLDFLLKLNEEIGDTEDIKSLTVGKAKEKVSSLFNSAVFGNNTTIIVGDHNTQTVSYITKGDFATLSNFLSEIGI